MVERELGQARDGVPARVFRNGGIESGGHEPEIRRRELPLKRVAARVAERLELLEVGELADVDLLRQVAADRLLERVARLEVAARERPRAEERLARPLPEEDLQPALAHLQHDGEGDVCR